MVGASSSVVWTFASESDTNQFTVTYRDGDNTYDEKTRYVQNKLMFHAWVDCLLPKYFCKRLHVLNESKNT